MTSDIDETIRSRLMRGARATFVTIAGFSLIINLLVLTLPLYMMQVFDRVMTSHSEQTLGALAIAALFAISVMAGLEGLRAKLMIRTGTWLDSTLSPLLFSAGFTGRRGARHARNLARLRAFLTGPGAFTMLDAPWVPVFLAVVFIIHPLLGFAALLAAVVIFCIAWWNNKRSRAALSRAVDVSQIARRTIEAVVREADTIAAMGMREPMKQKWLAANDRALEYQMTANEGIGRMVVLSRFVRLSAQILVVALATHLVIAQEIGLGGMIAASLIMSRALAPVEQALAQWRIWGEARSAWREMTSELSEFRPKQVIPLAVPAGRLSLNNVTWTPQGRNSPLFSEVSLMLNPGTFLALTGASGAGKSTLGRMIAGIADPDEGHIRLDGAEYGPDTGNRFAAHIGYVPQTISFLPGTVAENVARFTNSPPDQIVLAARRAGAHDLILSLPDGYETVLGDSSDSLSAGARQRVALARALFGNPRLLVLDEPYSNLDDVGVTALMSAISTFKNAGGTVVMVAHRPSLIDCADMVARLADGALIKVQHAPSPVYQFQKGAA